MGEWSDWGSCSKTCGGGYTYRTRNIMTQPQYGGYECGDTSESTDCNTNYCPIDCDEGEWSDWGSCSQTCGDGMSYRTRTLTPPQYGGVECGDSSSGIPCNDGDCPVECYASEWSDWGSCSKSCGNGAQSRSRTVTGDYGCDYSSSETRPCNTPYCPCEYGQWSSWGTCSRSCGSGQQTRARSDTTYQPDRCTQTSSTRSCNTQRCGYQGQG